MVGSLERSPTTGVRPRRGRRQPLPLVVAGLILAGVLTVTVVQNRGSDVAAAPSVRNVVVISTDDMSLTDFDVMEKTQRLLGERGVTFENAIVNTPVCCPSRATLLTGQRSRNNGVRTNKPYRDDSYLALDHNNTIATWLADAGMRTAHVGKYLNGYGHKSLDPATPNNQEIPPGWTDFHALIPNMRFTGFTMNSNGTLVDYAGWDNYQTDVLARRSADFIASSARSSDPFFLWVTPLAPHTAGGQPPAPAQRHRSAFDGVDLPRPANFDEADVSDKPRYIARKPRLTPARIAELRAHHEARLESLLAVDDLVETLVNQLSAVGELDRTLVIFTSDHGFMLGNHRLEGKVRPYEESIRIPLVMRGGPFTGGKTVDHLVSNLDVTPTIMQLLRHPAGRTMDGLELTTILTDHARYDQRALIVESVEGPGYHAVRTESWMWIEYERSNRELYDLVADPAQMQSLHTAGGRAAEARSQLASLLKRLRTCRGRACIVQADPGTTTSGTTTTTATSPTTTDPGTGGAGSAVTSPGTATTPTVRVTPKDRRLDVTWSHPDAQRFQLRYRRSGKKWIKQSSTTTTSTELTDLEPGSTYFVQVRAYLDRRWHKWNSVKVTTPPASGTTTTTTTTTTPDDPTGGDGDVTAPGTSERPAVTITVSNQRLDVSWAHPDATRFQLRYRASGKRAKWIWQSTTTSTATALTGLSRRTTYDVEVRAYIDRRWRTWTSLKATTT